jgi:hypothetical protein
VLTIIVLLMVKTASDSSKWKAIQLNINKEFQDKSKVIERIDLELKYL